MPTLRLAANFIDLTEAGPLVPERIENSGHLQFVFDGSGSLAQDEV
ncbi:hypothetical protein MNBD_ALPHA07-2126 [hydrothermal vent metagenome]|uniref:Uncharacterized protein n=1 Tax=hydrothermal vent metagenome TaxID=652676 RepID=A0A3B0S5S1_9ZZZZ